ncbi:MAG: glycosyltransferase, partial [Candidatus Saccharimonadales bacterium]
MAKIVIDAREYSTSTGRYVSKLIQNLQKTDNDHNYIVLLKPEDANAEFTNPKFTKVVCPYKEFTFSEQLGLKKQLDSLNADLVHFAMSQQPVRYGGKVVTTVHDLTTVRFSNPAKNPSVFWFKQRVYAWVVKRVARKSAQVIVPSKYVKRDLVDFAGINPDKVNVIYEAADSIDLPEEAIGELEGKRFLLYVGRPTPHKNLRRLTQAFAALKDTHPDLHLALVGKQDINYLKLRAYVNDRGID